jgi:outer membrane protein assembly factor BamE (lipoprotein component of BamABCDE complex)
MTTSMRTVLLLGLLLVAPACAFMRETVNEPLDPAALQSLRPGVSSADEVVQALGAPVDVVQLGRRSAYQYQFTASKRAALFLVVLGFYNQDSRADRVWVFFDEDQVLSHVGATFEATNVEYAMPWEELHEAPAE